MPHSSQSLLPKALAFHQAGKLMEAEQEYLAILRDDPQQADALHLLGVVQLQRGRPTEAVVHLRAAIQARPVFAPAHLNLGVALMEQGETHAAVEAWERARQLQPKMAEAHANLGNGLRLLGRHDEAVAACRQALAINPRYANAHNHLGLALAAQRRSDDALAAYREAIQWQPDHADARRNLAAELVELKRLNEAREQLDVVLRKTPDDPKALVLLGTISHQLGENQLAAEALRRVVQLGAASPATLVELSNVLRSLDLHDEAARCCQQVLHSLPDHVEALFNLAISQEELGQIEHAIATCRRAVSLRPESAEGLVNLAALLCDACEPFEAIELCRKALELELSLARAWNVLGAALHEASQFAEGRAACEEAVRLDPTLDAARLNRGLFRLARGEFPEGWQDYESRLKKKQWRPLHQRVTRPRWDGSPLKGRRLLLIAEQGFGDSFQFIRHAFAARASGGAVALAAPRPLVGILQSCPAVEQCVAWNDPWPDHDVYLELMSAGRFYVNAEEQIPAPIPYLSARPDLVSLWRERVADHPGFRIAIAWQGSNGLRDYRRVPVRYFAALAQLPGVRLFSVQLDGTAELAAAAESLPVVDFTAAMDREQGAFQDTAALLMHMDLVISSDTSIPHLAGALGRPVWLALREPAEWRWLMARDDTPWYPRTRLFRQPSRGAWAEVFQRMATELREQLAAK